MTNFMNLSCRDGQGGQGWTALNLGFGALRASGHDRLAHDIGIADKN
jgi:hypothetical protein